MYKGLLGFAENDSIVWGSCLGSHRSGIPLEALHHKPVVESISQLARIGVGQAPVSDGLIWNTLARGCHDGAEIWRTLLYSLPLSWT